MLSLYHSPDSRSSRFIWLLEELGADYQLVYCSIMRGTGVGERDPANPHPDKRVPALVHDGALVTESAAIALYLTDLMPDMDLARALIRQTGARTFRGLPTMRANWSPRSQPKSQDGRNRTAWPRSPLSESSNAYFQLSRRVIFCLASASALPIFCSPVSFSGIEILHRGVPSLTLGWKDLRHGQPQNARSK